jgi:hypothetical protein
MLHALLPPSAVSRGLIVVMNEKYQNVAEMQGARKRPSNVAVAKDAFVTYTLL